jgi:hypothetical protein
MKMAIAPRTPRGRKPRGTIRLKAMPSPRSEIISGVVNLATESPSKARNSTPIMMASAVCVIVSVDLSDFSCIGDVWLNSETVSLPRTGAMGAPRKFRRRKRRHPLSC